MKSLPVEVLTQIFVLLQQEDQLECMLICRLWKNTIEKYCLFRSLNVYSYSLVRKILEKIQEQPRLGNNVHRLTLHFYEPNKVINLSNFLEKLPNLQQIRAYGSGFKDLVTSSPLKISWYNHIKSIEDESIKSVVPYLLRGSICPNLTKLSVSDSTFDITPLLKTMPALKSLTLKGKRFRFADICKIHEYLPNLKTLQLKSVCIYRNTIVREIIPTDSVTEFIISCMNISKLEMELELLQFITKKYPNLVELSIETMYSPENRGEERSLYQNGWDPLLQVLGSQLKKLYTFYEKRSPNFLSILDKYNCQIQHLGNTESFPNIAQSQQVLYIRTLVLYSIRFDSLDWLKQLKILETLELVPYIHGRRFYFNDIIDNSPSTLKSLTFGNVTLIGSIVNKRQLNVRNLSFVECKLSEKISLFIDKHFPRLANLEISHCRNVPKSITLRLAELDSFCFIDSNRIYNYVLARIIYGNEERFYSLGKEEKYRPDRVFYRELNGSDFPPIKSQPADGITIKPDITLSCLSVKKIIL